MVTARRITRIVTDLRRAGLAKIEVEGHPAYTLPASVVSELTLDVGVELTPELEERLGQEADAEAAYRTALRSLERRPFARRDLVRRLVQKGHPMTAAEGAVSRAEASGLVDDEAFARHYVETRFARGRGPARLRRELLGFGVASTIVERAVAKGVTDEAADERMMALARKRAAQLRHVPETDRKRRVLAYLARRGFHGHLAMRATEAALA